MRSPEMKTTSEKIKCEQFQITNAPLTGDIEWHLRMVEYEFQAFFTATLHIVPLLSAMLRDTG